MLLGEENEKFVRRIYDILKWTILLTILLTPDIRMYTGLKPDIRSFEHIVLLLIALSVWNGCIYYLYIKLEQLKKQTYVLGIVEVIGDHIGITCLACVQGGYGDGFIYIFFMMMIVWIMLRYGKSLLSGMLITYTLLNVFIVYQYVYTMPQIFKQQKLCMTLIIMVGIVMVMYQRLKRYEDFEEIAKRDKATNEQLEHKLQELSYLNEMATVIFKSSQIEDVVVQLVKNIYKLTRTEGIGIILYGEHDVESNARYYTYKCMRGSKGYKPFYAQLQLQNIRTHRAYKNCILVHEPINIECNKDKLIQDILPDTQEKYLYLFTIIKENKECGMVVCNIPERLEDTICKQIDQLVGYVGLTLSKIQLLEQERTKVMRDTLTGVGSRRYIEDTLISYEEKAKKEQVPIGILFADIDHFKRFNDSYGHNIGDLVLKEVARTIQANMPAEGVAGRYGGEEFIGVLYGQDAEASCAVAEKIRCQIASQVFRAKEVDTFITLSIGVAMYHDKDETMEQVINRADQAMYEAKKEKNKVHMYED